MTRTALSATADSDLVARAAALHDEMLVWDDHAGFGPRPDFDLHELRRWADAGVDYLSVDIGFDVLDWTRTIHNVAAFRTFFEKHPDRFVLVDGVADVFRAKRDGKLAVAFDIEGMNALDGDPAMVSLFYKLGVRKMLFAYNRNNAAGGGCHDEDGGLTAFGRAVVAEMNRVGMLVDCSHCSRRTSFEAMEASSAPVIFSHSNPAACNAHRRNIADDLMRACAATGGVVGINGLGLFLGDPAASTSVFVDNICYAADLIGCDHVGIGLDYTFEKKASFADRDPRFWPLEDGYGDSARYAYVRPDQLGETTLELLRRGFSAQEVRGIMGGNFLRLASTVWT